jgi:hypothetical protein
MISYIQYEQNINETYNILSNNPIYKEAALLIYFYDKSFLDIKKMNYKNFYTEDKHLLT